MLAAVHFHDHGFQTVLGISRLAPDRIGWRGWFFALEREGGRAHRTAALFNDSEASQEIPDFVAAHLEADAFALHTALPFEIRHAVAVDDHALEFEIVGGNRRSAGARRTSQQRNSQNHGQVFGHCFPLAHCRPAGASAQDGANPRATAPLFV